MKRRQVTLVVTVDLDPMDGAFHTPGHARDTVFAILEGRIPHYNPRVMIKKEN